MLVHHLAQLEFVRKKMSSESIGRSYWKTWVMDSVIVCRPDAVFSLQMSFKMRHI